MNKEKMQRIIKNNLRNVCLDASYYVYGNIPYDKYINAKSAYAGLDIEFEDVIGLTDQTVFGSAKRGFLFTYDGFYSDALEGIQKYSSSFTSLPTLYNLVNFNEMLGELNNASNEKMGSLTDAHFVKCNNGSGVMDKDVVKKIYDRILQLNIDSVRVFYDYSWENEKTLQKMMSALPDPKIIDNAKYVVWHDCCYFFFVFTEDRFIIPTFTPSKKFEACTECKYDELKIIYEMGKNTICFLTAKEVSGLQFNMKRIYTIFRCFFDDIFAIIHHLDSDEEERKYYGELCKEYIEQVEQGAPFNIMLLKKCMDYKKDGDKFQRVWGKAADILACSDICEMVLEFCEANHKFLKHKCSYSSIKKIYDRLVRRCICEEQNSYAYAYWAHIFAGEQMFLMDPKKYAEARIDLKDVVDECYQKNLRAEIVYDFPNLSGENERMILLSKLSKYRVGK
jgi:hypothetical protein